MRVLLDTNVLLWIINEEERVPATLRARLGDPATDLLFSAVSIWEIAIKSGLDRCDFDFDPVMIAEGAVEAGMAELAVTSRHAIRVAELPRVHADPFDRLLVAQALVEDAELVTSDRALAGYPGRITRI